MEKAPMAAEGERNYLFPLSFYPTAASYLAKTIHLPYSPAGHLSSHNIFLIPRPFSLAFPFSASAKIKKKGEEERKNCV